MTKDELVLIAFHITEIDQFMSESDFQRDFFESLRDQFYKNSHLTPKQRESLQRMYERLTA